MHIFANSFAWRATLTVTAPKPSRFQPVAQLDHRRRAK
jgi:hypothetical protein